MTTPEQKARVQIDALLEKAGWAVQDADAVNIDAARGVAVREFGLKPGHGVADYLLYVDQKGGRRRRGQAGRLHAHRRRDPVGQVQRRAA